MAKHHLHSGTRWLRSGIAALLCASASLSAGCADETCTSPEDCEVGREFCQNGVCVPVRNVPPRQTDAGPVDFGFPSDDTGVGPDGAESDAAVEDGSLDSGVEGDGGPVADAGPPGDGGPIDGGATQATRGDFWAGDFAGAQAAIAEARIFDNSNAIFTLRTQSFPAEPNAELCSVVTRRLVSGTQVGLGVGANISRHGSNAFAEPLELSAIRAGVFRLEGSSSGLLASAIEVSLTVVGSETIGAINTGTAELSAPPAFLPGSPTLGTTLGTNQALVFTWTPTGGPGNPETVVVELYDRDREVVLTCTTDDATGISGFIVPANALADWRGQVPTAPAYLEVRRDRSRVRFLTRGTSAVPVSFRLSRGVRYPVSF